MVTGSASLTRKQPGKVLIASSRMDWRKDFPTVAFSTPARAIEAVGGADALIKLESDDFSTLLLDPRIEDLDVSELVDTIHSRFPELNVVMLEQGRADEQLSFALSVESPHEATEEETGAPQTQLCGEEQQAETLAVATAATETKSETLPGMIGAGRKMRQIYRLARLVAPRDTAVLIVGATGTGKELVARGIHELSRRSRGPFVVVNCAAIPESLLEAELFGFTRGAFTGAFQSRLGRIHAAHGGTLLLDEVGELPLSMQAKLLRFVQEGEVRRLGSADLFRVDARMIAATNADLLQRVGEKQFREDLYYRLAVFPLNLPPLRNRSEDVLPLAEHFLELLCRRAEMPQKVFSLEAATVLRKHPWPGNVRELQHWVERAYVLSESSEQIRAEDLAFPTEAA
jgi:transcriptional regulator with GAF, ATPase, and Fis domain